MLLKLFPRISLAVFLVFSACPSFSQTVPPAYEFHLPIAIGAGASNFDMDWGHNRMYGPAIWVDWYPNRLQQKVNGLGIEVEGRDINYGRSSTLPSNFRQDTFGGGAIYMWPRFQNFQPYGKGLIEFGSFDFRVSGNPAYTHDTRTLFAPGLGFQVRAYRQVWVRADYEYQIWQEMFDNNRPDPQGFTVGATFDFRGFYPRE